MSGVRALLALRCRFMDAATAVALASALLATVVAVVVPWLAFRYTLRQEQSHWLRERRAELYVDLLTEAYAEQEWLLDRLQVETGGQASGTADLRLPSLERARLGSRGNIYGSRNVKRKFNRIQQIHFEHTVFRDRDPDTLLQSARMALDAAVEDLQRAIRAELGADSIRLHTGGQ